MQEVGLLDGALACSQLNSWCLCTAPKLPHLVKLGCLQVPSRWGSSSGVTNHLFDCQQLLPSQSALTSLAAHFAAAICILWFPSVGVELLRLFCQQLHDAWGCQHKTENDILRGCNFFFNTAKHPPICQKCHSSFPALQHLCISHTQSAAQHKGICQINVINHIPVHTTYECQNHLLFTLYHQHWACILSLP